MSSVDNAKRQAKRLLKYAKNPRNSAAITIPTLNNSLEIISIINGYQNWYDYRLNLEKEDLSLNMKDKNKINNEKKSLLENKNYLLKNMPIELYEYIKKPTIKKIVKEHIPIVAGYEKEQNNILSFKKPNKKEWFLKEYPVFITGYNGCGKQESLRSFIHEYIRNKEGVIYISSDQVAYSYLFGFAEKFNRLDELYIINLAAKHYSVDEKKNNYTHTFDPINPMVDNLDYFINLFGERPGKIIQALIKHYHVKNKVVSIETIESFLNINNLIHLENELKISELSNYLNDIEYKNEIDKKIIKKHIDIYHKAYETIKLLKSYNYLFSHEPVIDFEDIFLNHKLLQVHANQFNAYEEESFLISIIAQNIFYTDEKIKNKHHYQNIILDAFNLYLNHMNDEKIVNTLLTTKNNYIFSAEGSHNNNLIEKIGKMSPTFISMKQYDYKLPDYLKIKTIDNMEYVPPLFYYNKQGIEGEDKKWKNIQDLNTGEMYVFVESEVKENKYTLEKKKDFNILFVDSIYVKPEKPKKIYVYPHG